MINSKLILTASILALWMSSCKTNVADYDASGSFEAIETIISAEGNGILKSFTVEEGQELKEGEYIGYIDTFQLHLKRLQLSSQVGALLSKKPNVSIQLAALNAQLATAEKEKTRVTNLIKGDAATPKQLDDINANIEVIKKQTDALKSSLEISSQGIGNDAMPLYIQIEQLDDQIEKCKLINPTHGTVLTKYAEENEIAAFGKPLYKIADLSSIILRAYITGDQLVQVKLNQQVMVLTDDGKGGFKETTGIINWINSKAEFTPKTIQTKDERANMVYALKVKVKNDGTYKIGMYGEIKFK